LAPSLRRQRGLTLIELILVMGLLATVLALGAPSLARFFEGRGAQGEARRLLLLIRYGHSQAVSTGVPMELWLDANTGTYGLRPLAGYDFENAKTVAYTLAPELRIRFEPENSEPGGRASILFQPDGFIDRGSPATLRIEQEAEVPLSLIKTQDNLRYEISDHERTTVDS